MAPVDYGDPEFTQPAKQIKAFNMGEVPQRIVDNMQKYEESARGFTFTCFEKHARGSDSPGTAIVRHRPVDSQVAEYYRMPTNPQSSTLERLTYFDLGTGRAISGFWPILGEDWRGVWREGGAILAMDLDGNEFFQLWRYWENSKNEPGGRIERLTHDNFKYSNVVVSDFNNIMMFTSNKENGVDTLVYVADLAHTQTGAAEDSKPFTLPSRLVTPPPEEGNARWTISDISVDDQYLLLTNAFSSSYAPCYLARISGGRPELIVLPNATEKQEETAFHEPTFSRDPATPHLVYMPELRALRPINWPCIDLNVTSEYIYFRSNAGGYTNSFDTIIEIKPEWEGGQFKTIINTANGRPLEVVLALVSHLSQWSLAHLDLTGRLEDVKRDEDGFAYISVPLERYIQAAPVPTAYRTLPAKELRFKSFDGLEIPCMYYHPSDAKSVVPVVISIHGGPESNFFFTFFCSLISIHSIFPIHWYIINELGYAMLYPNVRGSNGYGKRFMAADDVEKREDSVKDIGALLSHIEHSMNNELDASRIAACMIHFPTKFACGLANYPIAHWPSTQTGEYGDERIPEIRAFLEKISPINRTSEILAPLQIAHGHSDSRVPVDQAIRMYQTILKSGVHCELMVCEKEGHGFKQKSVIEYTNAAKLHFLERYLPLAK
ncbi:Alpha/Beta hydrolase protein [Mycena metata]|uniref:Dipeptidyl-peptidase V n=1 Tax=Mycena metata TaxID=1033252 RepID=A0AAD7MX70_9AGAR|nr:Alpha/Beta hydrolase protein [Mycena metata]